MTKLHVNPNKTHSVAWLALASCKLAKGSVAWVSFVLGTMLCGRLRCCTIDMLDIIIDGTYTTQLASWIRRGGVSTMELLPHAGENDGTLVRNCSAAS